MESIKEMQQDYDMNINKLQKQMLLLPNIIRNLRTTLLEQEEKLTTLIETKKKNETEMLEIVNQEVITNTKGQEIQKYKTILVRELEVEKRLKTKTEHKKVLQTIKEQQRLVAETKNDIEFCINRLKSLHYMSPYFIGDFKTN